jgi:hypothetical protein
MPTITTTDGTEIFFKDWGTDRPIVFSHGRSADDWDTTEFTCAVRERKPVTGSSFVPTV